jgi:UDP-GlcNAc:undecaprenyl-phosphate/decaprenyl-phosphate GlcNAc-1-phosphate transferase
MAMIVFRIILVAALVLLLLPQSRQFAESAPLLHSGYLLAISFLFSYLLMPFLIRLGFITGLIDKPDEARKLHKDPTPTTGGLTIYLAFTITLLLNFHFSIELKAIFIASSVILAIGILDDRFGLSATLRLIVQLAAALFLVYFGVRVTFVPDFLGGVFTETIITVIWLIGITNSMNFIDGMDGIAAGTSIIYSLFFGIFAILTGNGYMMFLTIAVAGSCLGFFPYNFRIRKPALAFLGDSGATFLGFLLASFAILGEWGDNIVDILVPVLIMSVLIFDMILTSIIRIFSGEVKNFSQWLHYTGRDHFHHRLLDLGISPFKAALLFFCVSICFGLQALSLVFSGTSIAIILLIQSAIAFMVLAIVLVSRSSSKADKNKAN